MDKWSNACWVWVSQPTIASVILNNTHVVSGTRQKPLMASCLDRCTLLNCKALGQPYPSGPSSSASTLCSRTSLSALSSSLLSPDSAHVSCFSISTSLLPAPFAVEEGPSHDHLYLGSMGSQRPLGPLITLDCSCRRLFILLTRRGTSTLLAIPSP